MMGIIGVIHVLASHRSVSGTVLLVISETEPYRDAQPQLLDFIGSNRRFRRHAETTGSFELPDRRRPILAVVHLFDRDVR